MDSGILEADELPKKHKWSENSKVYTRKFHRKPKNSNSNLSNATVVSGSNDRSIDKNHGETSCRIVVESNGGSKDCAVNGTRINVGNSRESVIEELPNNENSAIIDDNGKKTSENVIEEDPMKIDNVVGTHSENIVEEVPRNGNIDKEVPVNKNIVEDVLNDVNNTENDIDQERNSENNVEVPHTETNTEEMPHDETDVQEVPHNETIVEDVPHDETNIEEVPHDETNSEEVPHNETNVEEVPHDGTNVPEAPHDENNVDEGPGDDIEIDEDLPPNLSQPEKHPSQVETVTVSEDSLSHNRVEPALPNGHDRDENLANWVVREERPMVTYIEDRLNISVSAAKSREEVRNLKRKLEGELDQVRKMVRKVEAKETKISSVVFDSGRLTNEPLVVRRLRIPVNGGMNNRIMRPTQEFGSASYGHPRPFPELSVSVMGNSYHGVGEIPHEKEKRTPKANQYYRNSDFLLGKERLPPAESNRKAKSTGGGKKHRPGESELGFGFDKKINKKCSELLQKLRNHKHGWVFNQPVDVKRLGLHDYFDIIKHPMDLGTVKTRLTNHWYKTPREFAEDVRLTFRNAMTYNPEGQDVHIMAKELLRILEEKWPGIEIDYDRRLRQEMSRDLGTPTPTSRRSYDASHVPMHMSFPPPPTLYPPPSFHETRNLDRSQSMPVRPEWRPKVTTPRTPAPKKPKAKDPNKRNMTFDEKQKLTTNLQCLPSEKLNVIVQIIKKRNTALSLHDDEIEVDIDNVDNETLWELDRFVTNYKKSLSKHKRKAELAMQARTVAAQAIPEAVPPAPPIVEAPRENRADEGNVATSPPAQQVERPNDNASDSSSSSSSSSDSGSSSSDSDSSSSSDSGSDEDH